MPAIVAIPSENFAIHLEDHKFYLNNYIFKCKYSLFSQFKMWLQLILKQYRESTLLQVAQKYILAWTMEVRDLLQMLYNCAKFIRLKR